MKRTATATLLAGALGLLLAATPATVAATTADAPWSGYKIAANSTASGGWIGARKASGQIVYRIDPSRTKTVTSGFKAAGWQATTAGTGPRRVSATDTARAAWILSKYGSYKYAVQNAAVEVAVDELLHGGRWALAGAVTKNRLAQTSQASKIKTFASTMLADSSRLAGPYAVTLTPTLGRDLTVTVRVASTRTNAGIASLPVTVSYAGKTVSGLTTGSNGTASASFPAGTAGTRTVNAVVDKLPESRLLVRTPTTSGASRVAVAGLKTSRTVTTPVTVKATPAVTTTSTTASILTTQNPAGQLTVTGSTTHPRQAIASLYGPFSTAAAAVCTSAQLVKSATIDVTGNGSYALPKLSVPRYGHYIWGAYLPADAYNNSATSCAGKVMARVNPSLSATPTGSKYRTGAYIHGQVTVAGLPTGYADNASLRLYGPFTSASTVDCTASKLKTTQQVAVSGNGTFSGPDFKVTGLGYYLWAADLPASTFSLARTTSCTTSSAVFQVTW